MGGDELNIANIFFPETKALTSGYLIGYNYEGFVLVITSVIPANKVQSVEQLQDIIQEQKFQVFNTYCASELLILGVIESETQCSNEVQLSKRSDTLRFKQNQNIWITIKSVPQKSRQIHLELRDLIICEYKYKVTPHFILYPKQKEGEFLSISQMNFGEIINRSRDWDLKSPYIKDNELFTYEDLSQNDIIVRQINCSRILDRLIEERLTKSDWAIEQDSQFQFDPDFYGQKDQWFKLSIVAKLFTLLYLIVYAPYKLCISLLWIFKPLSKLNTIIQLKRKAEDYKKVRHYLRLLKEPLPSESHLQFDNHFYKMSIYIKLMSVIVQFVIDIALGAGMLFILIHQSKQILEILHYFGRGLHIEVLERQVKWLMGLPAGMKPNPNLDNFLGNLMLDIIGLWNYVTTELSQLEPYIIKYFALSGVFGINILLALCHDALFFCSVHIFVLYTVFAAVYKYILEMMGTLIRLFRGKKYNVLRKRIDQNNFLIQELYLGVLIVSLIFFLTPTIAMYYYACFITIILSIMLMQIFLLTLQGFVSNFPFYLLSLTIHRPYFLPNSFSLNIDERLSYFKIVPNKSNVGSVFSHLFGEFGQGFNKTFAEASPIKIIKKILLGDNLFFVMMNFLNMSARVNELKIEEAHGVGQVQPPKRISIFRELFYILRH